MTFHRKDSAGAIACVPGTLEPRCAVVRSIDSLKFESSAARLPDVQPDGIYLMKTRR